MTAAGDQLSEQHRQVLLDLRDATLAQLLEIWPAFRLDDVEGTWPAFAAALRALISERRARATQVGVQFVTAHRVIELGTDADAPSPQTAPPLSEDRALGTLTLLGPIMLKRSWRRGVPDPADRMLARLAGAATQFVLEGDRDTVARTLAADPRALGWRRLTSSSPCDFCADIAASGVTAADETGADFQAHDHCGCTAAPVYRRSRR